MRDRTPRNLCLPDWVAVKCGRVWHVQGTALGESMSHKCKSEESARREVATMNRGAWEGAADRLASYAATVARLRNIERIRAARIASQPSFNF